MTSEIIVFIALIANPRIKYFRICGGIACNAVHSGSQNIRNRIKLSLALVQIIRCLVYYTGKCLIGFAQVFVDMLLGRSIISFNCGLCSIIVHFNLPECFCKLIRQILILLTVTA